ncbi:MAG: GAF domain-containing protein, partial [Clostridia bacterium]|nr:GAF domain-containing protein [Clostridia bacterium]
VLLLGSLEELGNKFVRYALRVLEVEQATLVLKTNGSRPGRYLVYKAVGAGDLVTADVLEGIDGTLDLLFRSEKVVAGEGRYWQGVAVFPRGEAGHYLAVSVRSREGIGAVVLVADRREGGAFTPEDKELLVIFASQLGIALANASLYSRADAELQQKVWQLDALAQELRSQHQALQRSVAIHDEFTALVLRGQGLEAIAQTLARIVGNPVRLEDEMGKRVRAEIVPDGEKAAAAFVPVASLLATA